MINLKAIIVGFFSIIVVLWLLYVKIKNKLDKRKIMKMRKDRSKKRKK